MPIILIRSVLYLLLYFLLGLHATNLRRLSVRPQLRQSSPRVKNKHFYAIFIVIGLALMNSNYKQALLGCWRGVCPPFTETISSFLIVLYFSRSIKTNSLDFLPIFSSTNGKTLLSKLFVKCQFIISHLVKFCSPRYLYLENNVCLPVKQS